LYDFAVFAEDEGEAEEVDVDGESAVNP